AITVGISHQRIRTYLFFTIIRQAVAVHVDVRAAGVLGVEIVGHAISIEIGRIGRRVAVAVFVGVLVDGKAAVAVIVGVEIVRNSVTVGILVRWVFIRRRYPVAVVIRILVIGNAITIGVGTIIQRRALIEVAHSVAIVVAGRIVIDNRQGRAGGRAYGCAGMAGSG